ncbi:hypothetical protein MKX01_011647, partial [Papaver californicum]
VLLRNSITGSQVYLTGVTHGTKESAETVKKVINAVRPDAVALELCKQRALLLGMRRMPEKVGLVAMEESQKVKAKLVLIDQDIAVICKQLRSLSIPGSIFNRKLSNYIEEVKRWLIPIFSTEKVPRSYLGDKRRLGHHFISPEHDKLIVQERDILMCTRLRRLEEKIIIAVVGVAHMEGIELLWKRAEEWSMNFLRERAKKRKQHKKKSKGGQISLQRDKHH